MKSLRKTLVLGALMVSVFVGASAAGAGETVIKNGETIGGFRGSPQSMWVGRMYVPPGARQFIVTTSGGSGDCDLYLRRLQDNQGAWDFISTSNNSDERVALAMPAEGWWQIGLMGAGDYSDLTLHAQFDQPQQQLQPQPQPVVQPQPVLQSQPVVQPQPQPAEVLQTTGVDEFEPNSKRDLAMHIFTGQPQLHTINPDGDEDWVMFVPRLSGKYLLQITNVTADLEGELWVQAGKDKERRVEEFEIPRGRDSEILLEVDSTIGYFKLRILADSSNDVGSYLLGVKQTQASVDDGPKVRRPDVFESDNRPDVAVGILDNNTQLRTIYPRDDEDWVVFAPTRAGEYLLKFSDVTTDLKGELWVQRGDDREQRIDKFDVSRWGRTISLRADHEVRYFKIRIEADDNDKTGDYRLDVVPRSFTTTQTVLRTTVIYPTLRIPPFYRYHKLYIHRYPRGYGQSNYGRRSPLSARVTSGLRGSLLLNTGRLRIGVGIGNSSRTPRTSGRSNRTTNGGLRRSGISPVGRSTARTTTRNPARTTVRTPIRSSTPTRSTVRTPTRIPTRSSTLARSTVRTPTRNPAQTTLRTPTRIPTRSSTPARSTVRTPTRNPAQTTLRTPTRIPTRTSTPTRRTFRTPTRNPAQTTLRTPTRIPTRSSTPARSTVRTPTRNPAQTTLRTPTRNPAQTTVRTPTRIPTRSSTPARSTVRTPTRNPAKTTVRTPTRTKAREATVTPRTTESERSKRSTNSRAGAKRR